MAGSTLRVLIATIAGLVVAFALVWLIQYAGSAISPDVYDPETGEILISMGSTIALLVGWFVGVFAGAWIAMRASGRDGAGWVVAGAVMGASLYRAVTLADEWWIMALGLGVPAAAAWLAGRTVRSAAGYSSPA